VPQWTQKKSKRSNGWRPLTLLLEFMIKDAHSLLLLMLKYLNKWVVESSYYSCCLVQQQGDLLWKHAGGDPRLFLLLLPLCDKAAYAFWMWLAWTSAGACMLMTLSRAQPLVARLQSVLVLAHDSFLKYVISLKLKSYLKSDASIFYIIMLHFYVQVCVVRLLWSPEGTLQKHPKSLNPPRQNLLHNEFENSQTSSLFHKQQAEHQRRQERVLQTTDTASLVIATI
jgi:hypothetical protein